MFLLFFKFRECEHVYSSIRVPTSSITWKGQKIEIISYILYKNRDKERMCIDNVPKDLHCLQHHLPDSSILISQYPSLFPVLSYQIRSHHFLSYHVISYHIISHHIKSHHIISFLVISYHIISYLIISFLIISHHIVCCLLLSSSYLSYPSLSHPSSSTIRSDSIKFDPILFCLCPSHPVHAFSSFLLLPQYSENY